MNIAFKHPEFLYFLIAICIPVIIHLFSFRKYKKVFFHSIFLLKTIQQEQNKTRTKLKHLLVLAARMLTIAAVVIACAQPFVPHAAVSQKQQQAHTVVVYVDNSFSTQANSKQGMVLEYMITKARELVSGYSSVQKFYCITNTPNQLEHVQLTKEQMLNQLSSIRASAFTKQLSEMYASVQAIQNQTRMPVSLFVFSDFQKYSSDFNALPNDSLITIHVLPFEREASSTVCIDSCWFTSPYRMRGQAEELRVSVLNASDQILTNMPVKLYINDSLKAIVPCTIQAQSKQEVGISFTVNTSGVQALRVEIEDYPIVYDNVLYASYELAAKIPVVMVYDQKPNSYVQTLFGKDSYISLQLQDVERIDFAELRKFSVVVLDGLQTISGGLAQQLQLMMKAGKTVICIPSEQSDIESYNSFFTLFGSQKFSKLDTTKTTVHSVDYKHTLYANVFEKTDENAQLPVVFKHFPFTPVEHYSIIRMYNQHPFLSEIRVGQGSLFVFTSPFSLKTSSFVSHPLYVGLYSMGLYVTSQMQIYSIIGYPIVIPRPVIEMDPIFHIQNKEKKVDFIPQIAQSAHSATVTLHPMQGIQEAGHYSVVSEGKPVAGIAYNYSRQESKSGFYVRDEIEELVNTLQLQNVRILSVDSQSLSTHLQDIELGTVLWQWFILLAVLFVCAEVFIIRFFK